MTLRLQRVTFLLVLGVPRPSVHPAVTMQTEREGGVSPFFPVLPPNVPVSPTEYRGVFATQYQALEAQPNEELWMLLCL